MVVKVEIVVVWSYVIVLVFIIVIGFLVELLNNKIWLRCEVKFFCGFFGKVVMIFVLKKWFFFK